MSEPFNYTAAIRAVCEDICVKLPTFRHIQMDRVFVGFRHSRSSGRIGVWACVNPMRFKNGEKTELRRGVLYTIDDIFAPDKRPYLYLLNVVLPRFQDLTLIEKCETVIHELYHIGERFDGDIRRFEGRCYAHGSSHKEYDRIVGQLAREWLAKDPPPELWAFFKYNFSELNAMKGRIIGSRVRIPCIRPVKRD